MKMTTIEKCSDQRWVDYFYWLCELVNDGYSVNVYDYKKALWLLFNTPFSSSNELDQNRVADAHDHLREFYDATIDNPVGIFEVMVVCAQNLEAYMYGSSEFDEMNVWMWNMLLNTGLSEMTDNVYSKRSVDIVAQTILDRSYGPLGEGGLFTISGTPFRNETRRDLPFDIRDYDLHYQYNFFLREFLGRNGGESTE